MEAEPAEEPQVPQMPPPTVQDAPLLLHAALRVEDFSGHLLSHNMAAHQEGMLLQHVIDQLHAKSGEQVHVVTPSINAVLAAFSAGTGPRGAYQLYQDFAGLIEYVSGEVCCQRKQPVVLAWGVAPSQVASLGHKMAVLAAADIAQVSFISAVDVAARDVTNDVSCLCKFFSEPI